MGTDLLHRKKRKASKFESRRWPSNVVPYTIDPSFSKYINSVHSITGTATVNFISKIISSL